jgi:hypothetical protein
MPTQSFAAIWLTFSSHDLAPWHFDKWTEFCGIALPPWAPKDLLDQHGGKVPNFPADLLEAARTFAANFNAKTPTDRIEYMRKQSDNDAAGRKAIIDWVNWMMTKCKFKKELMKVIQDHNCHPRDYMSQMGWGPDHVSPSIHPSLAILSLAINIIVSTDVGYQHPHLLRPLGQSLFRHRGLPFPIFRQSCALPSHSFFHHFLLGSALEHHTYGDPARAHPNRQVEGSGHPDLGQ